MERVWTMATRPGSNSVAIGYDEGCVMIKVPSLHALHKWGGGEEGRGLADLLFLF